MKIIESKANLSQISPDNAIRLGLVTASDAVGALMFLSSWRIAPSTVRAWQVTEREINQALVDDASLGIGPLEALEIFFREVVMKSINLSECSGLGVVKLGFPQIGFGVFEITEKEVLCDGFAQEVFCEDALEITLQVSTLQALVAFSILECAAAIAFSSKEKSIDAVQ